jgi:hypothetical protein
MTRRSTRLGLILAGVALSAVILLAWTQSWVELELVGGGSLSVAGDVAAPALTALALSGLALNAALSIAGPVFRVVLGALQTVIGVMVASFAVAVIAAPISAVAPAVSQLTGVSGDASTAALIDSASVTLWPWLALVAGLLMVGTSIAVFVLGRHWPQSSRKYQAARLTETDGSPIGTWDALSDGRDPT